MIYIYDMYNKSIYNYMIICVYTDGGVCRCVMYVRYAMYCNVCNYVTYCNVMCKVR